MSKFSNTSRSEEKIVSYDISTMNDEEVVKIGHIPFELRLVLFPTSLLLGAVAQATISSSRLAGRQNIDSNAVARYL